MVRTIHADFHNDPKIKQVSRKTRTATIVKAFNDMGALPTFNFSSLKPDIRNVEPSGRATQPGVLEGDAKTIKRVRDGETEISPLASEIAFMPLLEI